MTGDNLVPDMDVIVRRGMRIDWEATRERMEQKIYEDYRDGHIGTDVFLAKAEDVDRDFEKLKAQYATRRKHGSNGD